MPSSEFYSHISDDKLQDGDTLYENIKYTINDQYKRGMIERGALNQIMDMVDGCSVQYRCGTVLFHLSRFAFELVVVYNHSVQPPGHGK